MPQATDARPGPDPAFIALALAARVHGLPADAARLHHEYGNPGVAAGVTEILRAARALGLKAREVRSGWERLQRTPLPALAQSRDGRQLLVAAADAERVLVHDPLEPRPVALDRDCFVSAWTGRLILLARRDGADHASGPFGLRWFAPALWRYRRLFGEVLAASLFIQLLALVTPLFFQVIVDKVLVHRGVTTLDVLAAGLLVVVAFEAILGTLRSYLFSHTTNRVDVLLGARLFGHLLSLPLAYFRARRVGDSVARVRELEHVRQFITGTSLTLVVDLLFTAVFVAVLIGYSPALTAVLLGSVAITPALRRRVEERFNRGAENQAFLVESVAGMETLKAMGVEPQMQRRWEEQLAGYVAASFRAAVLGNAAGQAAALVSRVTTVLILWIGATRVMRGELTVGQLVAFNMIAGQVTAPILRLAQLWPEFQQLGVSVRRLADILDTPREPGCGPGRSSLPQLRGALRLEHVRFRYAPEAPLVLDGVSLDIPAGSAVGIVGSSGSGKSTLAKLVQRLYVPEAGRLLVDGVDIGLVDAAWLRRRMGVVLQESVLFNRSVRENIALADPGLPMAAVVRAATIAGAHDFILRLPQGYDTVLSELGASLSGGQRQRVALARALVTDPRILILDEATSALDYESEQAIRRNMQQICRDRTVLIITHRLGLVRHCDAIVVLGDGRIVEQGTHDALVRRGGPYARLHALQSGDAVPAWPSVAARQPREA
ncbi:MAG: type I secretion system permease/ATPase [Gammaproteobacteria bacterium]|nr:type I secretion system permease/ATPase [Gammaproteobacteria bacterium]